MHTFEINTLSAARFGRIFLAILNDIIQPIDTESLYNQINLEENISNFMISTVATDGLALLGTRTSLDTVMTKFVSWM